MALQRPVRLRRDLRARVSLLLSLKEHHLALAAQQDAELARILQLAHGVNVVSEAWELDLARWLLIPPVAQP